MRTLWLAKLSDEDGAKTPREVQEMEELDLRQNGEAVAYNDGGRSALIFLGTGCSSTVPSGRCLIRPSNPPCLVCSQSLSVPPHQNPNYRCNTSLLIDYHKGDGKHSYILIDAGKTFREQVLRWFTFHNIPRVDSIVLTHEHADAVHGLDDIRSVQPHRSTNTIYSTPVYLSEFTMNSIAMRFPYLVKKKLKGSEEIRHVAQLDWNIIEENCEKPFVASAISKAGTGQLDLLILDASSIRGFSSRSTHFDLPKALETVKRLCPRRAFFVGMTHDYNHDEVNKYLTNWSEREEIHVQLARDGLRIPIDL